MNKETQQFLNYYLNDILVNDNNRTTTRGVDGIIGTKSNKAIKVAITKLKDTFQKNNYKWNNDMNLIAIRTNDTFTNSTTDWFILNKANTIVAVPCSTKAGNFWVYNPVTTGGITGTANLVEGQYNNTYQFVNSRNWSTLWLQTPYFQQVKPVTVYRDNTKDNKLDRVQKHTGLFGINIHTAGWNNLVDKWSAGCIVIPRKYWLQLLVNFEAGKLYDFTLLS